MQENTKGYELNWDNEIENDGPEYVLLPEGDYDFEITGLERSRYTPGEGAKLPACNMAILTVRLTDGVNETAVKHRLYLHSSCEGLLCAFFTAIGQRKHGERFKMDWNKVTGSKGRAKVSVRTYTNKYGETMQTNEIKKFYEPVSKPSFTPGEF